MNKQLRDTLLGRLEEVLRRNERVAARLRHASEFPDDWVERASLLADEEVLTELDDEARAEATALRAAIARVDDGTYGQCVVCGDTIEPGRLQALPTTPFCRDHAT